MIPRTLARLVRTLPRIYLPHTPIRHPRSLPQLSARPAFSTAAIRRSKEPSEADVKIDEIAEQYATARDEFEIAAEETEKKTVYAADDRAAAADEMKKLKKMYEDALAHSSAETKDEIQRRVGQRIRELEQALLGLEEKAKED